MKEAWNDFFGMSKRDLHELVRSIRYEPIERLKSKEQLKDIIFKYHDRYFPKSQLGNLNDMNITQLGDIVRMFRSRMLNNEHRKECLINPINKDTSN